MSISQITKHTNQVLKGGVPCLEVAVPEAARPTNASSKGGTVVLTLVYDTGMEAWMRVGDSRYALSDFAALVRRWQVMQSSIGHEPII